jgi:hypothetical protein
MGFICLNKFLVVSLFVSASGLHRALSHFLSLSGLVAVRSEN